MFLFFFVVVVVVVVYLFVCFFLSSSARLSVCLSAVFIVLRVNQYDLRIYLFSRRWGAERGVGSNTCITLL